MMDENSDNKTSTVIYVSKERIAFTPVPLNITPQQLMEDEKIIHQIRKDITGAKKHRFWHR